MFDKLLFHNVKFPKLSFENPCVSKITNSRFYDQPKFRTIYYDLFSYLFAVVDGELKSRRFFYRCLSVLFLFAGIESNVESSITDETMFNHIHAFFGFGSVSNNRSNSTNTSSLALSLDSDSSSVVEDQEEKKRSI